MGTDIHIVAEEEYSHRPGRWLPVVRMEFSAWRNYDLFRKLTAGIRERDESDVIPIAAPRGIPADADPWTVETLCNSDYHTPSWISEQEFMENIDISYGDFYYLGMWIYTSVRPVGKFRLIFAFDN